ncbi:MAG: VOC family protein [Terriglobales bacterium]
MTTTPPQTMTTAIIPALTRIGHVHLKVADLERALGFYCGVLGFELQQLMPSGASVEPGSQKKLRQRSSPLVDTITTSD